VSVDSSVTRRDLLLAGAAGSFVLASSTYRGRAADPQPNIIFVMADDLGYADLSCYGRRDYSTPNVDRIAADGLRFLQAYANSAVCSATRTALITGRYQYRLPIGLEEPLTSASTRKVGLPPEHPTLPSLLRKAGYGTTLIGKWHLGRLPEFGPLQSGYDHFYGFRGGALDYYTHKFGPAPSNTDDLWDGDVKIQQNGYLTDLLGERAVAVVNDYAKSKQQPSFQRAALAVGGAGRRGGSAAYKIPVSLRRWLARDLCPHDDAARSPGGASPSGARYDGSRR